ncbi:DUF1033 family protein [Bacillus sp. KH172YL63]|uniref:DUF1033 family protein n=1 Tax=Bacillus sp. KH172YL63 TaxID=2709784 RepID=UPI0013E4821D|nr:DUF1033 family protein [Bacillus sp. KH172YL63]BCB04273.1 hypothetical protein KH172YL63_24060 [Bacillus sp. KH172YL63]
MKQTWTVLTTKSDAEPWWFFEGWERDIVSERKFESRQAALDAFLEEMKALKRQYPESKRKRENTIAFWNPEEISFCEACDDDLQLYHGLVIFEGNKPMDIHEEDIILEVNRTVGQV